MSSFSSSNSVVRFGMFELSPSSGELRKAGLTVKLQPQPFKVLALLAGRAGEVVRRHEIQEQVWGGETFVDFERGLNFCIKQIRSALGDDAKAPRYVETLPKLGYRFIAPVEQTGKTVLAVLPFVNLSDDAEQEYFSDGLTEELITRLAGLQPRKLGVIARASVMRFKNPENPITIKEIGQALGADYVVEGSVRRAGSRFRITAQLIQVADETHLWADSYDGDYEVRDIFDIQDQVSRAVANKLRIQLVDKQARTPSRSTESVEAYELYRKGVYHLDKFTDEAMRKSITYFEQARLKDVHYAPPYAALALAYGNLAVGGWAPPRKLMPQAKAEVLKALELDDSVAEAHTALGFIEHWYEWDWPAADKEFRRAIELNPAGVSGHRSYSQFLTNMGRVDEAIVQAIRAVEIDPLSVLTNRVLANAFYHARRYDEAVEQCHKTIDFEPNYFSTYWSLGLAHMAQGNHREGLAALEQGRSLGPGDPISEAVLGWGYGVSGRAEEARGILAALERRRTDRYLSATVLAWICFGLGENDSGFEFLEKAYEERDPLLALVYVTPAYDPVRSDSRFRDLVERMRFPDPILA